MCQRPDASCCESEWVEPGDQESVRPPCGDVCPGSWSQGFLEVPQVRAGGGRPFFR